MSRDCGGKIFVLFSQKLEETLRADFRLLPVAQLCILWWGLLVFSFLTVDFIYLDKPTIHYPPLQPRPTRLSKLDHSEDGKVRDVYLALVVGVLVVRFHH